MHYSALMTDLYELTMLAGYYEHDMCERPASFDLFFRKNPFHGGYAVFAGLEPALRYLEGLHFTEADLAYLEGLNLFKTGFLDYLKKFKFRCTVTATPEGSVVFANEPLVTVEGSLAEAQLVETAMLNILNFQTLIATKAARIQRAAGTGVVVEFGLRRAHGPNGGLGVSRAAYIGGVRSTSNTWAGQVFGIPVKGTHAHSWVMAFESELDAFRAYAEVFPDTAILLVDTYDTLLSGIPNAVRVAKELRANGHELRGIRLDSGDLAYLSRQARNIFDKEGFPEVRIVASNELDEHVISSIRDGGGSVDVYGVGTELATAGGPGGGALGGVYKLVSFDGQPRMKTTSDIIKATLPGEKSLFRLLDSNGNFLQDVICCKGEQPEPGLTVFDPANPSRYISVPECQIEDLRTVVMEHGKVTSVLPDLDSSADHCADQLKRLPDGTLRLKNPHVYKVSISPSLHQLRMQLIKRYYK